MMSDQTLMASHEYRMIAEHTRRRAKGKEGEKSRPPTSLDLLYAMLEEPTSETRGILKAAGVHVSGKEGIRAVEMRLRNRNGFDFTEPPDTMAVIARLGAESARTYQSTVLRSPFILLGLMRVRKSLAIKVLDEIQANVSGMRTNILAKLSGSAPVVNGVEEEEDNPEPKVRKGPREPARQSPKVDSAARSSNSGKRPAQKAAEAGKGAGKVEDDGEASAYALDAEQYPLLSKITRNITLEAEEGRIDPVIGREKEIGQTIQILKKRRANNPVLVGEPGVGKTALVEGLALEIVKETPQARWLKGKIVLGLEVSSLLAGTQLRGSFSEKMMELRKEVHKAEGEVIIFIDEIHTIVGAGGGETALDAANELKTALARGEFPCIGATTLDEYKRYIEKDGALERRFQPVKVEEPKPAEAVEICQGIIGFYEVHHGVSYSKRSLEAAVRLSSRYMMDRRLPDKAIDVLDTAGAVASVAGRDEVTDEDVARVISAKVQVPVERMLLDSSHRFSAMSDAIREYLVGHDEVVRRVCETVKRGFAGFSTQRPIASFLFAGPPGMGKTQLARALAAFLFDSPDSVQVFQMSEYTERHSLSKLIGTAPGYVGYEHGGRLTELMYRRPFQLIVFRDLKSAHPDIQETVAKLIRTGWLEDGKSRRVWFTNTIIVVSQDVEEGRFFDGRRMGFAKEGADQIVDEEAVMNDLKKDFADTLFAALDERLLLHPLSREETRKVVRMEAATRSQALSEERNISFSLTDEAVDLLIEMGGFTAGRGGRDIGQTLTRHVESFLADLILDGVVKPGSAIVLTASDGSIQLQE